MLTIHYWFNYNIYRFSTQLTFMISQQGCETPSKAKWKLQGLRFIQPDLWIKTLSARGKLNCKFFMLCRLCCPVWWDRLVVCLLEWELWCFNELKGLLILNLITLLPPFRLLAFTLIVIYGSSTCFLINHVVIDVILFCTFPLSQLSKELAV